MSLELTAHGEFGEAIKSFGLDSTVEFAMLKGWNPLVETWSTSPMNEYLDWSSSSVGPTLGDYSGATDFASLNPAAPVVESTTFVPGQDTVITTNDAGMGLFPESDAPPTLESVLGGIFSQDTSLSTGPGELPSLDALLKRAGHSMGEIELQPLSRQELEVLNRRAAKGLNRSQLLAKI